MNTKPTLYLLVSIDKPGAFYGIAYTVGTIQECRIYQLENGLRATTEIIKF